MSQFICSVSDLAGKPVANCNVRITTPTGQNLTTQVTGSDSLIKTGPDGRYKSVLSAGQTYLAYMAAQPLVILASAIGYEPYERTIQHAAGFLEAVTIRLTPGGDDPESVDYTGTVYVSPLAPTEVEIPAAAPEAAWELIEATVSDENGDTTLIEVPIVAGRALVNLQARFRLPVIPHLVPDSMPAVVDPDFTGEFITSFASLTPTGRREIPGSVYHRVANAYPSGRTNDLTEFTNERGPARWLTPWDELPKHQGQYAAAMIWLPLTQTGAYSLEVKYQNINRALLETQNIALPADQLIGTKATHVRIPEPIAKAYYAILTVKQGGAAMSKPLNVRYIYG